MSRTVGRGGDEPTRSDTPPHDDRTGEQAALIDGTVDDGVPVNDGAASMFGGNLSMDTQHFAEHYIIEQVLEHVDELFEDNPEDDADTAAKKAKERRLVFQQLKKIIHSMDDQHVMVDLHVEAIDKIEDITLHMLQRLQETGVLQAKQSQSAQSSVMGATSNAGSGAYMKPAMAHRLAVPLVYADMELEDGSIPDTVCAFARLDHSTHIGEADGEGIRFVFLLLEHEESAKPGAAPGSPDLRRNAENRVHEQGHISSAEALAFIMNDVESVDALVVAKTAKDVHEAMQHYLENHIAWEKGKPVEATVKQSMNDIGLSWEPESLPFGGMKRDAKRRIFTKVWLEDWRDGMNQQSLAVVLFMFFACVAPAVAFGSLLDKATGGSDGEYCKKRVGCVGEVGSKECPCTGDIGVIEMLFSSAVCGIVYAVVGGSPLTILGGTGPILIFTGILYKFADALEVEFLPFYAWTSVWIGVFSLILAAWDVAVVIKKVTRFTDEIFAGLISLIFTISAIMDLIGVHDDGTDVRCQDNVVLAKNLSSAQLVGIIQEDSGAPSVLLDECMTLLQIEAKTLVSVVLAIGTYMIAMQLRAARKSIFMSPRMRNFLADFGVAMSIFIMVLVHELVFTSDVDMLTVPDKFEPTNGRKWWVGLHGLPAWAALVAIGPAIMGMLLVWLDNNITFRLVNSADHKLTKGTAYHWDTAITGMFITAVGLFGLPWLVAATVRSLLLVKSLATTEDVHGKVRIVKVNDNRLVGFLIHSLVLGAVFLPDVLKKIPLPVIFGLFLYMGISSMTGNTMFERAEVMGIWETDNLPKESLFRKVPRKDIVVFTLIQLVLLAGLYVIKSTSIGISFPFFIGLLPVARYYIGKCGIVKEEYCELLDPEELPEDDISGDVSESMGGGA